jgi:hypothetical protein
MPPTLRGMGFWLVKGNKKYPTHLDQRYGDLKETLEQPVAEGTWATKRRIPEEFSQGDGVFYWSSAPDCYVIGLGEVLNPDLGNDGTYNRFLLSFLTDSLGKTVSIDDLRESLPRRPDGDVATFLKAAAAQTIYSMTREQAVFLAAAILRLRANRDRAGATLQEWGLID